ncbi:MAG: acyltransferase family protein [Clostridia bacterium]|nr:acyltransferase family protein [Clostridia bacterium]
MKTKHILYLYLSLLLGYCTTEFISCSFMLVYISSALIYWGIICGIDYISVKKGHPVLSAEKRIHSGKREAGGDIARTIAVLLVPFVHFFGLTGYYNTEFTPEMIFPSALRWLGVCAVPIFMIISGCFKVNAKICKKHYFAIIPLLFTHIFISLIRIWVDRYFHGENVDITYIADRLVYFKYGWYIRLYIGMLLLMPFFNIAYKNIGDKWKKEVFILTLVGLNALGPLTFDIIPSSWLILYVFGYYIIGCYLSEYRVKINAFMGILGICGLLAVVSTASYFHCKGGVFDWSYMGYQANSGYSSMVTVFVSVLIMVLCLNIDFDLKPLNFMFKAVSLVSLEMYLFSQMFDGFIYKDIIENNVPFRDSFGRIFILAGSSALLSFGASWLKKGIFMAGYLFKRGTGNEQ